MIKRLAFVVAAPVGLLALAALAWFVDTRMADGEVVRNTELAGRAIGGQTRAEVRRTVQGVAQTFSQRKVSIDAGEFRLDTTAGDLGLAIDVESTVERAMDVGRDDPAPQPPVRWLQAMLDPRVVDVALTVDSHSADAAIEKLEGERRTEPREPALWIDDNGINPLPGEAGRHIRSDDVVEQFPRELDSLTETIEIKVERHETKPTMTDKTIVDLAAVATAIDGAEVTVRAGDDSFTFKGSDIRKGMTATYDPPQLSIDPKVVNDILTKHESTSPNPTGVTFTVGPTGPVVQPGRDAVVCCGDNAAQQVVDALLKQQFDITVDTRTLSAAEAAQSAQASGVATVIGEFTTRHKCCENRVTNIHRIVDLVRGQYIAPGATFSVNDFVGPRTADKGFVKAGVIVNGEFDDDYGGGVSQFATTLFNAAFFGGLDIPAYKAHSIYISRYPFGREATLAYPGVDLKIRNNTPHGVVIWATYTDTSVTVQLWSTPYARGEQTSQNKSSGCGDIRTTRTRTYVDGRTETDTFRASYDCDPPDH